MVCKMCVLVTLLSLLSLQHCMPLSVLVIRPMASPFGSDIPAYLSTLLSSSGMVMDYLT